MCNSARKASIRSYTLGSQLLMLLITLSQLHSSHGFQHTTTHLRTPKDILCIFTTDNPNSFNYHMSIANALSTNIYFTVTVIGNFPVPHRYEDAMFQYIRLKPFASDDNLEPNRTYHRYQTEYQRWQQFIKLNVRHLDAFLWKSPMKSFDLVILAYYGNIQHLKFAGCFGVPIILSFDTRPNFLINSLVGNPPESAYMPSPLQNRQNMMSPFWERYKFWLLDTLVEWTLYWNEIFHDIMGSYDIKHFSCAGKTLAESRKQIALIFTNHHFSQSLIRPNVPAIVEIGGIHISDYKVNLLPDLLRHINTAENGFIYINLGSSYNCSDVPTRLTNILYDYFTTNRMFVVWRWAYCIEPPTSPFIYYQTWLDQAALLSNPDLLAFITHGSQNSLTEGIHYNVKMLAITTTPEQMANAEYLAAQGAMLHLRDVEVVSPQMLHFSLYNLIHDPTFKQVAATLSEKYRDRPLTPRQTVLYWANYVLRYRGAVHLRSPAVDMHYFQRIGLDFVLVTLALLLAFYIAIAQVRKLFKPPPFTPKNQYDYIMAAPGDMYKIDETKNYQIRPTSSDDTAGEETAGEDKAREAVEEDVAGPVMQPNRPRQRKNIQKNKRK